MKQIVSQVLQTHKTILSFLCSHLSELMMIRTKFPLLLDLLTSTPQKKILPLTPPPSNTTGEGEVMGS